MHDLFETQFDATKTYILNHIESSRHKLAFEEEANYISEIVKVCKDLDQLEQTLIEYKEIVKDEAQNKPFWTRPISDFFFNDSKYSLMAYEEALELTRSLKTRFVTGGYGTRFHYSPKK